jgi:hypothetical protein
MNVRLAYLLISLLIEWASRHWITSKEPAQLSLMSKVCDNLENVRFDLRQHCIQSGIDLGIPEAQSSETDLVTEIYDRMQVLRGSLNSLLPAILRSKPGQ